MTHDDDAKGVSTQWELIRGALRREVGDAAFKSWVAPMTLAGVRDGEVRLSVPTRFMRDWVMTHYAERIRALWSREAPGVTGVDFVVQSGPLRSLPTAPGEPEPEPERALPQTGPQAGIESLSVDERDSIPASLDQRFVFSNFVVGKPNEFAYAAARRVAESSTVSFNPLFLYGGVGLGKTHLMHAIAWHIHERDPRRKVIYLSAEKFMYRFVRALRFQDTMAFKEQFRS
ncbi:MAG: chromosomal replication initiator protein DnaA, partial [Alphaproteobacteria bacterium]|nr:chromosomal replication initiator protein DnaA [Alphaproteobacteria bacterium]